MNRRLTNAHYRHHYPIKFSYFGDDTDGFCTNSDILHSSRKYEWTLLSLDIIPAMIWHKSSYHWLLRLRIYEGVDWIYKRKFFQSYNIINFKLDWNIHLLKFLSVPCCWSWLTPLWHLLCYCSHHWFILSIYVSFTHFYALFFSRIFITSPCSESYIFVSRDGI